MQTRLHFYGRGITAFALAFLLAPPAIAEPCLGPDGTSAPTYCAFASTPGGSLTVTGGGHTITLGEIVIDLEPSPPGPIYSFFDIFAQLDSNPFELMHGPGLWFTSPSPPVALLPGAPLPIELLQLDFAAAGFMLRESPTLASTGQASSQDEGGGQIRIDSFFDVFVELSLDNGTTWIPSTAPLRLTLQRAIPEPGGLALAGLALLLLAGCRRRQ